AVHRYLLSFPTRRSSDLFLQRIYDNGDVYEGVYSGLYCVGCEEFKSESDLVDGKCPIHDTVPEAIEEKNYFFRLSAYQERLLERSEEHTSELQSPYDLVC